MIAQIYSTDTVNPLLIEPQTTNSQTLQPSSTKISKNFDCFDQKTLIVLIVRTTHCLEHLR